MADRYPLVVNSSTSKIQELPAGNNLNLHNNGIVNAGVITATGFDGPIVVGDAPPTPSIVTDNIVLSLDAGDSSSYSGSGTTWTDLSGQGNHATLVGGLTYSSNDGGYLIFDGSNDHATLPAINLTGNEITFTIWNKTLNANTTQALIFFGNSTSTSQARVLGAFLPYGGNNYYFDKGWDGSGYDRLTGTLSNSDWQNAWVHWAFTANASTGSMKIYRNGSLFSSGTGYTKTFSNANGDMRFIGKHYNTYNGYISNLQLYKKELSQAEVTQNYDAFKERFGYGGMGDGKSNIVAGINTTASMRVGGDTSSSEDLVVTGDARVTGILTVGTSSLTITDRDINAAGVATCGNFKTGSSNVHSVGIEAAAINSLGADTPIGAGATIYNSGAAVFTGTVTAGGLEVDGNITVGGELTYNDVKSVDSIGIITARSNIVAQGNIIGDGATNISGMNNFTATTYYGSGANLTGIDATQIFTNNTSVQTVDTGSNGHVKFTTDGGERLRVSKDGAIGLGGANYGTSGQVIHSQGSGSAAVWSTFQGVPSGVIMMWSGAEGAIPSGWYLCNGQNSTPDLRNKFIVGAGSGSSYSVGNTGGANSVTLSTSQIPAHSHTTSNHSHNASVSDPGHGHSMSISDPGHQHNTSVTGAKLFPGYGGAHVPYGGGGGYPGTHFNMSNANTGVNMSASNANTGLSVSLGNANPSTNNTGGGGSHENRPPYYALCYIMKS